MYSLEYQPWDVEWRNQLSNRPRECRYGIWSVWTRITLYYCSGPCANIVILQFLPFLTGGIEFGICMSLQDCRTFWLSVTSLSIPLQDFRAFWLSVTSLSKPGVVPTHRTPGRPNPSNSGSSQPVDGRIGRRWADHCQTL